MRAHVREVVHANREALRQDAKRAAHGSVVPAKGPFSMRPLARENDVHGAPGTDGSLQLASSPPDGTTVLGSDELGVKVGEKGSLHTSKIASFEPWGNVV